MPAAARALEVIAAVAPFEREAIAAARSRLADTVAGPLLFAADATAIGALMRSSGGRGLLWQRLWLRFLRQLGLPWLSILTDATRRDASG
jgi:hypothetical protein